MTSFSTLAMSTPSTAWRYALAFFLVVVAIGLVYLLVKAGKVLGSLKKMVTDLGTEMMPLLEKIGTTVDEVNQELDKVNEITGSVVGITQRIDSTTQSVGSALSKPAKKAAAFTAGAQQAVSSFVSRFRGGGAAPEAEEPSYRPPVYQEPPAGESPAPPAEGPSQAAGPAPEATPATPPDEPPADAAAEGEPS